jgi:hypothetical protein
LPDVWDAAAHLFPPLPGMNICSNLCTSGARSRLRRVSVKAKPGERPVDFVPYPLGSGLFLTSMRGLQEKHGFTLEHVDPG